MVRITTLEQTLLDTLHRPLSCGGPPIVIEAWEHTALGRSTNVDLVLEAMATSDFFPGS
jgi:predicted transcriptional regulator of viral defense system